ncbi:hypothetical protein [Demequina salsinemoris]|uniref:hypothetical protein n=1 Tax=Demequina salsinemoris TaxID=577470 RepID=UPI000783A548|nr:hypothetical protein [Demequina salsinemoris]
MTARSPEDFGRAVVGPVVAEFCLRLWNLARLIDEPGDTTMLFCARGGLPMLAAYERFLVSTGLESPVRAVPLMTSRLTATRPALAPALRGDAPFAPAGAATLFYEFSKSTNAQTVKALSGFELDASVPGAHDLTTPESLLNVLVRDEALEARAEILRQSDRFDAHLRGAAGGANHVMLVDTGLHGTTGLLVAEGFPDLRVSSALIARIHRPLRGAPDVPTHGLLEHSNGYSPLRRRSVLLRYWHFVEWLFEPELPSVRRFDDIDGAIVSNLEQIKGWQEKALPAKGSILAGAFAYLERDLKGATAERVLTDAPHAWRELSRAIVWPTADDARVLDVGTRSHDFGREGTWTARQWQGPVAALKGSVMWREGEIARASTPLRLPLLAAIELGYGARPVLRKVRRA